jgi:hypothetical protein
MIEKILTFILLTPLRLLVIAMAALNNAFLSFFSGIVIPFLKNKGLPFIRQYVLPFILNKVVPFIVKNFGPFFEARILPIYKKVEPYIMGFWDRHGFYFTYFVFPCFIFEVIGVVVFGHSARAYFEAELASFLLYMLGRDRGK